MKKVLIITYYWPPSGGAGVQRWVKFAKYLSKMDVEVYVLTVEPEFATYPQLDETLLKDIPDSVKVFRTKSVEIYTLYKKLSSNKEIPFGGFANSKKANFKEKIFRFIRGNFFLPDPRRGWNRFALKKAKEIIRENNIETIITTSPPHSTQLIGLKLIKQMKVKWIADLRDPWTDIYYYKQLYPTLIATWINKSFERKILRRANRVITVSNDLKRLFANKLKKFGYKIDVIPNGFDVDDFVNVIPEKNQDKFIISYVGTISKEYSIDGFINGINQLPENIKTKSRIRFIGQIPLELENKLRDSGLGNMVELIGYVPHNVAIEYMFSSDVLLLIIPDVKNNNGILTGKIFEYLASKKPILFLGPENGDAAKIIYETKSGIVCNSTDSERIKNSLVQIYQSSQNLVLEKSDYTQTLKYSRENLTKNLIQIIQNL